MDLPFTTPGQIDDTIALLLEKLPAPGEPVFLDLFAEADAELKDCYGNVAKKILRDGGGLQYGWCVWLAPGKLVEGEFHAVWVSQEGQFVDITPKPDGETRILFIPDRKTIYKNEHIDNVRVALTDDPAVHAMIKANEKLTNLFKRFNDGTGRSNVPMQAFLETIQNAGRNEACPCGSGKKFKKCCISR